GGGGRGGGCGVGAGGRGPREPLERGAVGGFGKTVAGGRLVEPQAEHHTLAPLNLERKRLELALGSASGEQGRDVPLQARRVAPTAALGFWKHPPYHPAGGSGPHARQDFVHAGGAGLIHVRALSTD